MTGIKRSPASVEPPKAGVKSEKWVRGPRFIVFKDEEGFTVAVKGDTGEVYRRDADSAAVIQAAIDALTGGKIFIKDGTYRGNSTFLSIVNKNNIHLIGESHNTIFKRADNDPNYNTAPFILVRNSSNIVFEGLTFNGNKANNNRYTTSDSWMYGDNVFVDYLCTNVKFVNVQFKNALKYGVQIARSSGAYAPSNDIEFRGCKFSYNAWNGFLCANNSTDIRILGCLVEHSSDVGISVHGCRGVFIGGGTVVRDMDGSDGYTATGTGVAGSRWGIGVEPSQATDYEAEVVIDGAIITGCHQGIRIYGDYIGRVLVSDCIIRGNNLSDAAASENWSAGIYIEASIGRTDIRNCLVYNNIHPTLSHNIVICDPDCSIIGCFIDQSGATTENAKNIVISSGGDRCRVIENIISNAKAGSPGIALQADNCEVVRNRIVDNTGYGINIYSGADNNIIKNNYFSGNTGGAISDNGAGNIIKFNTGYVTENSGLAMMDATGMITVTHNLDETPVIVKVTPQADIGRVWVPAGSIGATGFTVACSNPVAGTTVFWDAYGSGYRLGA